MERKTREIMLHKKVVKNYNNIREKETNSRYYSLKGIEELIRYLPQKDYTKILDVGCGTGIAYEVIKKRFPNAKYYGIDLSKEMIEVGKKRYRGANFKVMDCEMLNFKPNSFDLVIGRSFLHHIPNPSKSINEIKKVVKNEGYIAISEPHNNYINQIPREFSKLITKHFDEEHCNFTTHQFKNLFIKKGLKIKKIKYFGYLAYPFAFPDIIKIFKYFPKKLFKKLYLIDKKISKMPLIKKMSWHILCIAKKEN